jgi:hypothetical protein
MTKEKPGKPAPPSDFADLAAAFAMPGKTTASSTQEASQPPSTTSDTEVALPPAKVAVRMRKTAQVPQAGRGPGRPKSPEELVNQTLSLRADQMAKVHKIAAAEYGRLGRRVLPSEIVRSLLDIAFEHQGKNTKVLKS